MTYEIKIPPKSTHTVDDEEDSQVPVHLHAHNHIHRSGHIKDPLTSNTKVHRFTGIIETGTLKHRHT